MSAGIPVGASQVRACALVDIRALPRYPGAMQLRLDRCLLRRAGRGSRPGRRPLRRRRSSSSLRPPLRLWLRPCLRSCLRRSIGSQGRKLRSQCGLRAGRFADISTHSPVQNIKSNRGDLIARAISLLAPLALGAFAIASALAPQRFASSTAPIHLARPQSPPRWRGSGSSPPRWLRSAPASNRRELGGSRESGGQRRSARGDDRSRRLARRASRPLHRSGPGDPPSRPRLAPHPAAPRRPRASRADLPRRGPQRPAAAVVPERARPPISPSRSAS